MTKGLEDVEANDTKYKWMLAWEVPVLEEEVKVVHDKLQNPVLHSNLTTIEEGVALIEKLKPEVDKVKERGKTMNE